MDKLVIEGGTALNGSVPVSGAKNAALPILIATLLAPGEHIIENVPALVDVSTTLSLLGRIGCPSLVNGNRVRLDTSRVTFHEAPYDLVRKMRASVLALGPLLARCGEARVSLPGGCAIGVRPIDQHLKGLEALGCEFTLEKGYVHGKVDHLKGAEIHLDVPTVTGTENILMAAVLADGITHIHNAAREPEVVDLARFLSAMGARISGAGTSLIEIDGVPALRPARTAHHILPDRIEAGTYLVAGAITGGTLTATGCPVAELQSTLSVLEAAGCDILVNGDEVTISRSGPLRPLQIETQPHPGFPTDMQAQVMAMLCLAGGQSVVAERIFENRFMHIPELCRLGANIATHNSVATIDGVEFMQGATVMATDLRASASLVLAGLAARGQTQILRLYHLDRGYENLVEKLRGVGARIARVPDNVQVPVGSLSEKKATA